MEAVTCYCKKCDAEAGRFRNSWNGIGNTYFSPVYPPLSLDGIQATGELYEAARDSQIQDSLLQDVACENCGAVFGLRCDKAPDDHVLKKNQLILRLSDMSVLSERSGRKAKIAVFKTIPLTAASVQRTNSVPMALPPFPTPQSGIPDTSTQPQLSTNEGTRIPLPTTTPAIDLSKFKSWAEDAISSQQKDINRLSGSIDRIERSMSEFKEFMKEIRTDFASLGRALPNNNDKDGEIANLRSELNELRQRVNENGGIVSHNSLQQATKSIDGLVENVQRFSQRAEEVDALKLEVREMKSRIQSLEVTQRSLTTEKSPNSRLSISDKRKHDGCYGEQTAEEVGVTDGHPAKRRKVPNSTLPFSNRISLPDIGEIRDIIPSQQQTVADAASAASIPSPQLGGCHEEAISYFRDGHPDTGSVPDPSTPLVAPTQPLSKLTSTCKVVVESGNSVQPPIMMPLRNGTIFNTENRNEFLEASHFQAATGQRRDSRGRWVTASKGDQRRPISRNGETRVRNAVFANGLISNAHASERGQGFKRTLRPRKDSCNMEPIPSVEVKANSDDGPIDDPNEEEDEDEEEVEDKENANRMRTPMGRGTWKAKSINGFSSTSTFSRADRENTLPPIQIDEAFKKTDLPQFYQCGTCKNKYRTLQALDYHQEHHSCNKSPEDVVPVGFRCGNCEKVFKTFTGIKNHMTNKICKHGSRDGTPIQT